MKTEHITPVDVTEEDKQSIAKLLLNAWTCEYALRITSIVDDPLFAETSLRWSIPQAYYGACFSLRAVLVTLGCRTSNGNTLLAASTVLHKYGLYKGTDLGNNFLYTLNELRVDYGQYMKDLVAGRLTLDLVAEQKRLVSIIERLSSAHEAHILDVIGQDAYATIVVNVPTHLQRHVFDRFANLPTLGNVPT